MAYKTDMHSSQLQRLGSSRADRQIHCLIRAHFLVYKWPTTFSLCLHMTEGARELSGVSFERAFISFERVPPSRSNCFPSAPPPNTITLGTRISTYEFERGTNIQSISAGMVKQSLEREVWKSGFWQETDDVFKQGSLWSIWWRNSTKLKAGFKSDKSQSYYLL